MKSKQRRCSPPALEEPLSFLDRVQVQSLKCGTRQRSRTSAGSYDKVEPRRRRADVPVPHCHDCTWTSVKGKDKGSSRRAANSVGCFDFINRPLKAELKSLDALAVIDDVADKVVS